MDQGSKFYNRSITSRLRDIGIEMNFISNKGKSVVAERFVRTLKNKIYKNLTPVSRNVYINKLNEIVETC